MGLNDSLHNAKKRKCDEFYTRIEDIISEIGDHEDYCKHFKDKVVYLNCDSEKSAFWQFFRERFHELGLTKLIATHYEDGGKSYKLQWSGELLKGKYTVNMIKTPLKGDGDFRSDECVELLKSCDIVVTNPPFSLFREYVAQLMEYNKKFVIIGNKNSISYKEVFPLLKEGKMFVGYNAGHGTMHFATEIIDNQRIGDITHGVPAYWFTNLDLDKPHEPLILTKNYYGNEDRYPKYDNYDAIDCNKISDIPKDYMGKIGVPITYMASHCFEQFEIIGSGTGDMAKQIGVKRNYRGRTDLAITENGKSRCPYNRIIIQRKPIR